MKPAALIAWAACCGSALASSFDLSSSDDGVCRYILDGWAAAQGDATGGNGVLAYESVQEIEVNNGTPKLTLHLVETDAGHVRLETTSPQTGTLIQAYDGRVGWRSHGQWGIGPMSKSDVQTMIGQARLDTARGAIQGYPLHTLLPSEERDGRPCYVVGAIDRSGVEERWLFDKQTHERVEVDRPSNGNSAPVQIYFADFRPTGGLTLPYHIRFVVGAWAMTIRRSKLLINPPVDESSFVLTMDQLREINAVTAILQRHAAVSGGDDDSSSRVVRWTVDSTASGLTDQVTVSFKGPRRVRYEVETSGMGRTLEVYNGRVGWMAGDILGFHWLTPAEDATLVGQAYSYRLPRLADKFPLRRLVGERIVNGRHTVAVDLATLAGPDGTYYFDRAAGRLLRYIPPRAKDPAGTVVDFSDFRAVAGGELPFVTTVDNFAGQTVRHLQSIATDIPVADELFELPSTGH